MSRLVEPVDPPRAPGGLIDDDARRILAVGVLPPPVRGMPVVTEAAVRMMRAVTNVETVDLLPRGASRWYRLRKGTQLVRAACRLIVGRRFAAFYLPVDAGFGAWGSLLLTVAARLRRTPVVAHHHSWRYLDAPHRPIELLVRATRSGRDRHVVLCARMERALRRTYPRIRHVVVVSNELFLPSGPRNGRVKPIEPPLTLGFLGNITLEKGIDVAIAATAELARRGLATELVVAGPVVDRAARAALEAGTAAAVDFHLTHMGPVSGDSKEVFFSRCDLLLFPSRHRDEAQPLVVLEARARGVPTLASDVGCIPCLLSDPVDGVAVPLDDYVAGVERHVARIAEARSSSPDCPARAELVGVREAFLGAVLGPHPSLGSRVHRTEAT